MEHNTTEAAFDGTRRSVYALAVPALLLGCFLSFIFNAGVLLSVRWLRRVLSPTLCFSLSLTFADAYSSLLLGTGLFVNSYLPSHGVSLGPKEDCFRLGLEAFRLSGLLVSALHLLALAVNHYLGILRPLHYASTVTRRTCELVIGFLWIGPIVFFLVYFSVVPGEGFQSENCSKVGFFRRSPFSVTLSSLFALPLLFMMFIYCHIYVVIRHHRYGVIQMASSRHLRRNVKAVRTTLCILGTYIACWMPAVVFFVLTCVECPYPITEVPMDVRVSLGISTNALIIVKALVDPFIYAARMPEVKDAVLKMIHCHPVPKTANCKRSCLVTRTDTLTSSLRLMYMRRGSSLKTRTETFRC
ncbi:adrenocorticotropic hormone receptor-like [Ornithodoros turicata]|uniref:adrenocorticotropic hormone receptor-like n=1 Tax=Ornithodoros turicata TaxID=34597 RepID=UPI003139E87C